MTWLLDQILALLASDAGSLAYHVVLAFSIAAALQISFTQTTRLSSSLNRRALFGLGLLLLFQLALFISSGLVWQGLVDGSSWLPLFDRSITLLSLIMITWLWCFPHPDAAIDAASLMVAFIALVGSIFGSLWWIRITYLSAALGSSQSGVAMNGAAIDYYFQIASLSMIGLGLLFLIVRRPAGWGYGMFMLALLTCGHIAHMLLPYGGDYPIALRLFEMAAYPFLLILPQRQLLEESVSIPDHRQEGLDGSIVRSGEAAIGSALNADPSIWKSLLALISETHFGNDLSSEQACKRIAATLAGAVRAEYVFLVSPSSKEGELRLLCGFENTTRRYLESAVLDARSLPILASSLRMGRIRRLAGASSSQDRVSLSKMYGLENGGAILFVPVLKVESKLISGAILVAGQPANDWNTDEQATIGLLTRFLIEFLHSTQRVVQTRLELEQVRQSNRRVQDQAQLIYEEEQKLRDQIAVQHESLLRDQDQIAQMSSLISEQASLQQIITGLTEENQKLQTSVSQAEQEAERKRLPLTGELRLALEEVSLLRTALTEMEARLIEIDIPPIAADPSASQLQMIMSIAQDLRQPLASIVGYTDVLLSETIGILGTNQRRYIERIKLSTERFGRLLEELSQVALIEADPSRLKHQELDLSIVIQDAFQEVNGLIQLRHINLKLHLPDHPLRLVSDPNALRKVVTQLLRNAATVTPEGGEVNLFAKKESGDHSASQVDTDYVLIQVADRGIGFAAQDLGRVFSPHPISGLTETQNLPGLASDSVDFARIKTLVEALGGRAWVDSEQGNGAVFSLLLPGVLGEGLSELGTQEKDFQQEAA